MSSNSRRALISAKDLILTFGLLFLVPIAGIFSVAGIRRFAKRLVPFTRVLADSKTSSESIINALHVDKNTADEISQSALQERITSLFLFLKKRFFGLTPEFIVEGEGNLRDALSTGHGVVLWVAELTYCPDSVKEALSSRGYTVSHLSRSEHGFSSTKYGIRILNPLRTNYEIRFLKKRILINSENRELLRDEIADCLNSNECVSVLASAHVGASPLQAKFLSGYATLAGGAPAFAYTHSSRLLPVYSLPSEDLENHIVTIGDPINLEYGDKRRAVASAVEQFLQRLEPIVRAHPELYLQWEAVHDADS